MTEWWMALGDAGQVFACIAIPATVILLIQLLLTLIGLGGDENADADADTDMDGSDNGFDFDLDDADGADADFDFDGADDVGDIDDAGDVADGHDVFDGGLRVFTLRGFVAFFSVLGWAGVVCCSGELSLPLSITIATASGILAMLCIAIIMKWLFKLQYDGTEDIRDAMGVSGTVYLRIPPSRTGRGKISAIIQGKLCEKNAVTDEETTIEHGEEVTVVGISGEETLIVRRKNI